MSKIKNWIWHQKFGANEAESVNSYFNISNEAQENKLFLSSFDGTGLFNRQNKRKQIGFKR